MSEFADQGAALRLLAARLDDTAHRLAGLPAELAGAWDEPSGREWADRLELVRRETVRRAADTAQLAETLLPDPGGPARAGADPDGAGTDGGPGARLGGTGGTRTSGPRGVVAPLLGPYGSTAGPA